MRRGRRTRVLIAVVIVFALLALGGCTLIPSLPGARSTPQVSVLAPADQSTLSRGEMVALRAVITDTTGIARTELWVNDRLASIRVPATPETTQMTEYLFWNPDKVGPNTIKVVVENLDGGRADTQQLTFFVVDSPLQMTAVAVEIATATWTPTPTPTATVWPPPPTSTPIPPPSPTWSPWPTPTATYTPMPSATYYPAAAVTQAPLLTSTPVCIDKAEYVTDVTLPGETHVRAGSAFYKVWQLRNAGTCTWNAEYRLVFVSGSAMTQQTALPLPEIVYPGKHVNVGALMVAPEREGTYYSEWQMRNPAGRNFGDSVHVLANVDSAP